MAQTVKVEGLRELERALEELPRSTGKSVLRRVLKKRAQPIANAMRSKAPVDIEDGGQLRDSVGVGTKLSKRQRGLHRKAFKNDKASVEMFVGAGPLPQAHLTEFGGPNNAPAGWARSSWDAGKDELLDGLKADLWAEIEKAAQRHARKMARLARKG
ncbi:HK97 gp10 family phage protein [Aurantimonas sp. A2-1-M11]|uniref:HK97 gp10 family phage protein n=1 Tax=Aurantimonas sp. A2-1-M11 TaxID=3113712 RepID=UPI002F94B9CE